MSTHARSSIFFSTIVHISSILCKSLTIAMLHSNISSLENSDDPD